MATYDMLDVEGEVHSRLQEVKKGSGTKRDQPNKGNDVHTTLCTQMAVTTGRLESTFSR